MSATLTGAGDGPRGRSRRSPAGGEVEVAEVADPITGLDARRYVRMQEPAVRQALRATEVTWQNARL